MYLPARMKIIPDSSFILHFSQNKMKSINVLLPAKRNEKKCIRQDIPAASPV